MNVNPLFTKSAYLLPRKPDKVLQWYSVYKLAGLSVEALHEITLRVLEKRIDVRLCWFQILFEEWNCPMETDAPIARACPIGCAMGFKYMVVDTGLGVMSKLQKVVITG